MSLMHRCALLLAASVATATAGAQGCGSDLGDKTVRIENPLYVLAYVARPSPIALGRNFTLDFAICPRPGVPLPQSVRIAATMPEHRHGMNYRPVLTEPRPGTWHVEGMLFHMAGRWELAFELIDGNRVERLTGAVLIE
ncbi:MAG: hypothetical protein ABIX12_04125 [Rubrivivax sp.]